MREAVKSVAEARAALARAETRRSTRSTVFNATSSRSHSLVYLHVTVPDVFGGDGGRVTAWQVALVDLAGSERLPAGSSNKEAVEESRHINLSLSALGSVIHALQHRAHHLPFRTCLLTRLLEPFFSAGGHVTLGACVSPEAYHIS